MKYFNIETVAIIFLLALPNYFCYQQSKSVIKDALLDIVEIDVKLVCHLYALEEITILLLLYTRDNPIFPIVLNKNNVNELRHKEKNVVIINGYVSTSFLFGPPELRNEYLKRYDANVIMIDWTLISFELYPISVCKLPTIAKHLATFFCEVNKQRNISLSNFHFVGTSMGAHMSGLIGQNTAQMCEERIGRITGLDPAGPLYQNVSKDKRLDSSDALFVDIIHTDETGAGYYGNLGDVDFHVNCGEDQPGCPGQSIFNILGVCSHSKSWLYMIESVNSENFIAQSCSGCPEVCRGDTNPEYIVMGENCPKNSTKKVFWIPTHSVPPLAAGCSLYKSGCT